MAADAEKITINLGVVDLGKIDLLVEEGFYHSRTDFIRAAIRFQLDRHEDETRERVKTKALLVGVMHYTREELEQHRADNESLQVSVVGLLSIANDVTPELALATIDSIKVNGVFRASKAVKEALADRIH